MSDEGYSYDDNEDYGATRGNPYAVRSPNAGSIPAETVQKDAGALTSSLAKELKSNDDLMQRFNAPGQQFDPLAASKAYDAAAQRIRARSSGPSRAEQLFAISAALSQPTKYSGPGAMFSNLSPALQELQEKQRKEQYTNTDQADELNIKGLKATEDQYNDALTQRNALIKLLSAKYAADTKPRYKMVSDGMGGFNYVPIEPSTLPNTVPSRPQNVPVSWSYMVDRVSNVGAWVSPDKKQHVVAQ